MMERKNCYTDFTIEAILNLRPKAHFEHHYDKENDRCQSYHDQEYIPHPKNTEHENNRKKSPDIKKTRTVFTRQQLQYLENAFKTKKYFNCMERKKLAEFLALTETQVKIWLQNRRNKWKKHATKSSTNKVDIMAAQPQQLPTFGSQSS